MTVPCRLIHSLEVAISVHTHIFYKVQVGGSSSSSKVQIRGMLSRLLEYIFQNILSTNFHKIKVSGGVWVFKIAWIHSFTGPLKTHFLLFQKMFEPNRSSK